MKNFKVLLSIYLLFIASCSESMKSNSSNNYLEPSTPLILISIDGFRWDYFDKADTPNFDKVINNGIQAEGLKTVYPSKTFPNHISIITGNYPSNHGIISNYFYDPSFDEYYYMVQEVLRLKMVNGFKLNQFGLQLKNSLKGL